jgi:hypothetical protein
LVHHAKQPKTFWWVVATWFFSGILLIGDFLYRISN